MASGQLSQNTQNSAREAEFNAKTSEKDNMLEEAGKTRKQAIAYSYMIENHLPDKEDQTGTKQQ